MSKFEVYKDYAEKYRFRFRAENGRIVAVGEAYEQHASCINGIKSVQKNCKASIEDQTIEDFQKITNPKYEVYKDAANKFRFRLKAANGQIIAESEGYETKNACLNGIGVVGTARDAEIEDSTVTIGSNGAETGSMKAEQASETVSIRDSTAAALYSGEKSVSSEIEESEIVTDSAAAGVSKEYKSEASERIEETMDTTITSASTREYKGSSKEAEESVKMGQATSVESRLVDSAKKDEMLEELKKIRQSVEKPPEPQPPKGFWNEFKDFLKKFGILALAIGFIIGLYLGGLVQALVKDLLLPAIGLLFPDLDNLATMTIGPFAVGDFLVALVTFIIVALVVFLMVKIVKRWGIE